MLLGATAYFCALNCPLNMSHFDIALLTDSRYVKPAKVDLYVQNILDEDKLLINALAERGLQAIRADWADENFAWQEAKVAVFRTTWDYFDRFTEFTRWLDKTRRLTHFVNPYSLIKWNLDKHYLLELQANGVNIPATIFIEPGATTTLAEVIGPTGWPEVILKPAVSGAARHTYRIKAARIADYEKVFQQLTAREAMMVQPFQQSVPDKGEIALMYFNGKYSHAVLKKAKAGDFRVQDDFGGTVHPYKPTAAEIALGEKAISICRPTPVYGRVDILEDNAGNPAIGEVELIEPELWFRMYPPAARLMAAALGQHIANLD